MLTRSRQLHFVITTPAALSTNPRPASAHRFPSAKHPFWFSSILPPLRPSVSPEEEEEEEAALALLACRFFWNSSVSCHSGSFCNSQAPTISLTLYTPLSSLFSPHTTTNEDRSSESPWRMLQTVAESCP